MTDKAGVVPTEFDDAVAWAAWLYYADELTQSEIAQKLGVSRATIVNYLQEARSRGIVSIGINMLMAGRTALARRLAVKFGLSGGVVVIPDIAEANPVDRIGQAGARLLAEMLSPGDVIGVAWGRTVLAVADQITLREPVPDLTVVQVSGSSTGERHFAPELCTSLLASRLNARCANLLAPAVLSSRGLKDALLAEPLLRKQFALIHSTTHILFGVGDIGPGATISISGIASAEEMEEYKARGAIGVIIGRFIDKDGRPVGGDHDDRMVGIGLDELKCAPVRICVAGGPNKIEPILATLKGGYVTHLVTDFATAELLASA